MAQNFFKKAQIGQVQISYGSILWGGRSKGKFGLKLLGEVNGLLDQMNLAQNPVLA